MNFAGTSGAPSGFGRVAWSDIGSPAQRGDTVTIADAHLLFSGNYERAGSDLIVSDHLHRVVVSNYFHGDKRPALVSAEGVVLDPNVIEALTGHVQYAQAGAVAAAKVIGHVVKMTGSASIVRNGVTIALNNGDVVYQNDVVQTGSGSTLGLVLIDGTTFNLTANARLMMNDLTYDPASTSNTSLFTLVQGAANFVAGQVAKTGDMKVSTPVATMGIRGTAVILDISAVDGKVSISVVNQRDGQLHAVEVYNTRGDLIGTVTSNGSILTLTPTATFEVIAQESNKSVAQALTEFNAFQQLLSTYEIGKQLVPDTPAPTDGRRGDANPQGTTKFAGTQIVPSDSSVTKFNAEIGSLKTADGGAVTGDLSTLHATGDGAGVTRIEFNSADIQHQVVEVPTTSIPFVVTPSPVSRISSGPGDHFGPVMSADGQFVTYDPDGSIFLFDRQSGTTKTIASAQDGFSYGSPTISADGRFIVYQGSDGTQQSFIFIYNNDASDPAHYGQITRLMEGGQPAISGDGSRIVIEQGGSIGLYDQQGHQLADLTGAALGITGTLWKPAISADGHIIAFWSTDQSTPGGAGQLFTYDLSSATFSAIASTATGAGDSAASFSADGHYLVYQSDAPGGHTEIYLTDLRSGEVVFHTANADASYNPVISPDGHFIIFASDARLTGDDSNNFADVYVVDVTDPAHPVYKLVSVLDDGTQGNAASNLGATISAGGQFIAFGSSASNFSTGDTNGGGDIFVVDPGAGHSAIILEGRNSPAVLTASGIIKLTGEHSGVTLGVSDSRITAAFDSDGNIRWSFSEARSDFAALQPGEIAVRNFVITLGSDRSTTEIPLKVSIYDVDQTPVPVADAAPVASPVTLAPGTEDAGYTVTSAALLAGVVDIDGPSLSITGLSVSSGGGTIIDNHDGTFHYSPAANYNGPVVFNYTVSDGTLSASSTAHLDIAAVNDAPVLTKASFAVSEGGTAVLTSSNIAASDVDNAAATFTVSGVTHGKFQTTADGTSWADATTFTTDDLAATHVRFVHDGSEDAPTFSIQADDGEASSHLSATVSGTVNFTNVNDAPVLTNATLTVSEGETVVLDASSLGVSDPDSASFSFAVSGVSHGTFETTTDGTHWSSATTFSSADLDAGHVRFVHDGGEDAPAFSVQAGDGAGGLSAVVAGTVNFTNVNDAPAITQAVLAVSEGGTVVLEASDIVVSDPDSAAFTFTVSNLGHGGFQITADDVTWTDTLSFTTEDLSEKHVRFVHDGGEDAPTFSLQAYDGADDNSAGNVLAGTVDFTNVNDAPVMTKAALTVSEGETVVLTAADIGVSDPDSTSFVFTVSNVSHGKFQTMADGDWADATTFTGDDLATNHVRFVHDGGEDAPTFSVQAYDGADDNSVSNVLAGTVTFTNVNDPASFVAGGDTASMGEDDTTAATGVIGVSDPDDGESHTRADSGTTALGSWSIDAGGHWSYTLNNAAVQHLGATASTTDTFTVTSQDGTASEDVTVTINGANDKASFVAGGDSASMGEDDTRAATGIILVNDVDDGENHTALAGGTTALGSSWSIDASGHWTYTLNNAAVQHLGATASTTDTFTVASQDGTASEDVTITINGANDGATFQAGGDSASMGEDDTSPAAGIILVNDVDDGENHTALASGTTALGSSWSIDAGGHWSYTLNNAAVQHLGATASTTDTFTVHSQDGTAHEDVTITINGANDKASFVAGGDSASMGEDNTAAATGIILVSDADDGENHTALASGITALGSSWSIDAGGHWSYTLNNAAVQHLGATDSTTDTFTIASQDGTASEDVTITINGANDKASFVAGGDTASMGEDDTSPASGNIVVKDPDDGESHTKAAGGTTALGSWSIDASGHWSYTLNNAAVQHLGATDSTTDTFTIASQDGTASEDVTITINGANDKASFVAGGDSTSMGEDDTAAATDIILVSDADDGQNHTALASGTTALGSSWSIDAGGHWSYTLNNAAVQHLGATASTTDTFTVHSQDGTASEDVTITINGANDKASFVAGGDSASMGEDDTKAASGVILVNDADDGENHTKAAGGATALGSSWSIDATGHWSYTLINAAVQHLGATASTTDKFTVTSQDGTASEDVTVTINGANDKASFVAGGDSTSMGEDDTKAASGDILVNDADDGENHTAAAGGTTALGSSWSIDAGGHWTYTLNNAAVQHLGATASTTDTFTVHSQDGTASEDVTITINGANDGATFQAGGDTASMDEDDTSPASGNIVVKDPDDGENHTAAAGGTTALGSSWSIDASGHWTYTLNNAAVQHLGATASTTDTFTVHSQDGSAHEDVTITINGANDAPSITAQTLASITEDAADPAGHSVFDIFDTSFEDVDDAASLKGIAVIGDDSTAAQGVWQYKSSGGGWEAIGHVDPHNALIFAAATELRFLPGTNFNGTPGSLHVVGIDDSYDDDFTTGIAQPGGRYTEDVSVRGGSTPFSDQAVTLGAPVTAVNDAPVATGVATLAAIDEDNTSAPGDTIADLFGANFSDAADGSHANTFAGIAISDYVPDATRGAWQYATPGGSWTALGAATATAAITFSTEVALRFVPAADYNGDATALAAHLIESGGAPIVNGATVDLGTAGTGGSTHVSAATVTLGETINPVDDAPVIDGGDTRSLSVDENTTAVTTVVTHDVDGPSLAYTILSGPGSPDAAKFNIDASGVLSFVNAPDFEHPSDSGHDNIYTVQVNVSDGTLSDTQTLFVRVADVNDNAPVITTTASQSVAENNTFVTHLDATDVDTVGGPATFTIANGLDGSLFEIVNGNLQFRTAPDFEHPADADHDNVYSVKVNASDGTLSSSKTISVQVTNVNEAPVLAPDSAAVTWTENAAPLALLAGGTLTDPDNPSSFGDGSLTADLAGAVSGDELVIACIGGVTMNGNSVKVGGTAVGTVSGNHSTHLTINFTPNATEARVDAVLQALAFDSTSDNPGNSDRTATVTFVDDANNHSGSALSDSSTVTIHVTPVNDAPVNSIPGTQSLNEDAALTFSTAGGNAITISDVDAGSGDETVTLTVSNGKLTLGSTSNLTSFSNNAAEITLTGTVAHINAALNGLTYRGNPNFNGSDSLRIATNDNGNSGSGGASSDVDTVAIRVIAVEDSPVITGTTATGSVPSAALTATAASYLTAGSSLINGLGGTAGFGATASFGGSATTDDGSTNPIDITSVFGASGLKFFGHTYTSLYINNNGNITFTGPSGTFTPSGITGASNPIIAPFWADVDTRGGSTTPTSGGNSTGSNLVYESLDTVNHVLTVTWDDVGYYNQHKNLANAFQLQLIGLGNGDFDIVFRYESINWTTGDASGGSGGLGGSVARAGYSAGDGSHYFEIPGSGNQSQVLAFDTATGNTGIAGVDVFQVQSGSVTSAPIANGTVQFTDPDTTDVHTASFTAGGTGYHGTFTLDPVSETGGSGSVGWHFALTNTEVNNIAVGAPLVQSYTIAVNDGHSGIATQTVSVSVGSSGADTLNAGHAADVLIGAAGNDTFAFSSTSVGNESIVDFTHGADILQISVAGAGFAGHGLVANGTPVVINAAGFATATGGSNGDFIFDTTAQALYWDANGGSGADAVLLAHFQNVSSLSATDFHLV